MNIMFEEPYMTIRINNSNRFNHGMHTIHTINALDDLIVVDGIKWTFSPIIQIGTFLETGEKKDNQKGQDKESE